MCRGWQPWRGPWLRFLIVMSCSATLSTTSTVDPVLAAYVKAFQQKDFLSAAHAIAAAPTANDRVVQAQRHFLRANAYKYLGSHRSEAIEQYRRATSIVPTHTAAYNNLGLTLKSIRPGEAGHATRCAEAVAAFKTASQLRPAEPEPWVNLGCVYADCGQYGLAAEVLQKYYDSSHNPVAAWNLAMVLHDTGRKQEAEELLIGCLESHHCPDNFPQAQVGLSSMRYMRGQTRDSLALLQKALRHQPRFAIGWAHFAHVLSSRSQDSESTRRAFKAAGEALRLQPTLTVALTVRGTILGDSRLHGAAAAHFRAVRKIEPGNTEAMVSQSYYEILNCEWIRRKQHQRSMRAALDADRGAFPVNAVWVAAVLELGPLQVLRAAERVARSVVGAVEPAKGIYDSAALRVTDRLGVGYLSSDFGNHPVRHAIDSVLKLHDRTRWRVYGYAMQPTQEATLWRGKPAAVDMRVIGPIQDAEAGALVASDRVHILLDMNGYTLHHRSRIMHMRPAPARMSLIGDNKSSGGKLATIVSYICVDRLTAPPSAAPWYVERLVMLPHFYHGNSHADINPMGTSRSPKENRALGLVPPVSATSGRGIPDTGWVMESFNRVEKLSPPTLHMWLQALRRLPPGAVLRLLADPESAVKPLILELLARGADPDSSMLRLAKRGSREEYLGRVARADLAVDSTVANGEMTNLDMMWLGPVPLVTMPGQLLMDKFGSMAMHNLGVERDAVVHTRKGFEDAVVAMRGQGG